MSSLGYFNLKPLVWGWSWLWKYHKINHLSITILK